ncbi:CASTOR/POLLUX-related putative ion channel [Dysosmobacter sp.]|uniref:CASTOR/POLLUX-related putative ion channel n=1 Tax=Dysosmobacter sp. TaxID=2591382 RepID=UPI002A864158|nr:hypothetical protein [Dysosmobacter sp.]MDY3281634.1 hypothetical protein [Dysosmobacter sp.]
MDKRTERRKRLSYWFDNMMSSGIFHLIRMLALITVVLVIVVGIIIAFVDADSGHDVLHGIWLSLTHIIDPGQLGEDTGSAAYVATMIVVTIAGLLVTSTLIGVISNAIDNKIHTLQRGKSMVLEKNHVIVLGCAGGLYTIVSELIEANANQRDEVVVIMDDKEPKDVMDEKIRQKFPDTRTTRVICRSGSIADFSALEVCSFGTCRSVIINAEDDAMTIKSILAATNLLKKSGNTGAYIAAVIRNQENVEAAQVAGEGYAEIISFRDIMSRIIAHTCRNTGLSKVYTEILDFSGSELYVEEHPAMVDVPMGELNRYFPISTVIGIELADGTTLLNPEPDRRVGRGDKLILFAEDDCVSVADAAPAPVDESAIRAAAPFERTPRKNMLILGHSDKIESILQEEDHFVAEGSHVTIALAREQGEFAEGLAELPLRNFRKTVTVCDIYSRAVLAELLEERPDSVLVLCESAGDIAEAEKEDAKTILLLLQLKYLKDKTGCRANVTSEMLRVENQELAQITEVNDFVVSSNITSLMLTQISQLRELRGIFEELLAAEGSEICIRPARDYIDTGREVDICTACAAAQRRREVLIGYRTCDPRTGEYTVITNPPKQEKRLWAEDDAFVVIAQH